MLLPMLVFPTPGGPTRQMMLPLTPPVSLPTPMNSRIRSLISFKPIMVLLEDFFRLFQIVRLFAVDAPGDDRQPIEVVAADAIFGRLHFEDAELVHLFADDFITSSGTVRFLRRSSNFSMSIVLSSFSMPSSFLIVLSCSRKKNSRCVLEIVASIFWLIVLCSLLISSSFFKSSSALSIRLFDVERLEDILQLFARRRRQGHGKIGQPARLCEIGMAQERSAALL